MPGINEQAPEELLHYIIDAMTNALKGLKAGVKRCDAHHRSKLIFILIEGTTSYPKPQRTPKF